MRKKKDIPTLGLTERVKKTRTVSVRTPRASGGLNTYVPPRGTGRVIMTPDQVPLMPPKSDWTRPSELPTLQGVEEIALDTETVDNGIANGLGAGWALGMGHVAGVGIAWRTGTEIQKIYVPVAHPDSDNFDKAQVARWVTDITRKRRVVFFNAGYDIGWLHADMGVPVPPAVEDASCAAFLVDENRDDLSLDGVCDWRGVPGKDLSKLREAARAFGYREQDAVKIIGKLPARYAGEYGQQDPASTLDVMDSLRPELARQGLIQAYQTEMRLIPLMHAMRKKGIRIDVDRAEAFKMQLEERCERVFAALSDELKMRVGSEEVRGHLWLVKTFDMLRIPVPRRGGKHTFERDWMRRSNNPVVRMVAEARQCMDMADKFVGTYLLGFANNGRIHATVNQWLYEEGGTRSHRLSYADPPLQQAPSRGEPFDGWDLTLENALEYRGCFLPEENELWFSPDYSQQEYRHIVADSEKHGLEKADVAAQMYRDDPKTDFHNLVVSLTGLNRRHAKDCNFAKAFGAGIPKFAVMTSKTLEEATEIMGTYDKELPFVKQLAAKCQSFAERKGYINMFDGARSHFDAWEVSWLSAEERSRGFAEGYRMNACSLEEARERQKIDGHPWQGERLKRAFVHKAMNRRIQGNAARQMKMAMAQCWEEGIVPMLQMHDEISVSITPTTEGHQQAERAAEIMRTVYQCSVPFLVDSEFGTTWGDAKHTWEEVNAGTTAQKTAKSKTVKKDIRVRA
jgi:DNA polymerase I-like protein with 3'-5' exonuclease and polymerase domains